MGSVVGNYAENCKKRGNKDSRASNFIKRKHRNTGKIKSEIIHGTAILCGDLEKT